MAYVQTNVFKVKEDLTAKKKEEIKKIITDFWYDMRLPREVNIAGLYKINLIEKVKGYIEFATDKEIDKALDLLIDNVERLKVEREEEKKRLEEEAKKNNAKNKNKA